MGRSTLSTSPITSVPPAITASAFQNAPVASRTIAAGTHTSAAPTAGSSDRIPITTPQNTAAWIPTRANSTPPIAPCTAATTIVPFTVARETSAILRNSCRSRSSPIGIARMSASMIRSPSRKKKKRR